MTGHTKQQTRDVQVGIRITQETKATVERICTLENKKVPQVINDALELYLSIYPSIKMIQAAAVNPELVLDMKKICADIFEAIKKEN